MLPNSTDSVSRPKPDRAPIHQLPRSSVSGVVFPALPAAPGATMLAVLFQLGQSQWWPPDALRARQFEQLAFVLRHACETIPFHRERLAAAGYRPEGQVTAELFARLPIMTRSDVQMRGEALLAKSLPPDHGAVYSGQTSGSTGSPIRHYGTDLSQFFWSAGTLRDHLWHGRDFSGKHAVVRAGGTTAEHPSWGREIEAVYESGATVLLGIKSSVSAQLLWLQQQQPDYLLSHPSNVAELARESLARGIKLSRLREVRTIGEVLQQEVRDLCRDAWGVPVVDTYSAAEVGYIALQCPKFSHYHVQSENLLVEVLDERGQACGPGTVGRVVVTTLHNFAMPLVRYELGDYAEVGEPCPCGRGLPVLRRIIGRVRNMLVTATGERYWPALGSRTIMDVVPVQQFQLVQKEYDLIEARLVTAASLTAEHENRLRRLFLSRLPPGLRLNFVYCDNIPRSASGKFEDFVSEVATPRP